MTEKETIQKNISGVLRDNSLVLNPLSVPITMGIVNGYFKF